MIRITRNDAADILKSADKILILTHQSPDGDTLGSGYAICRALRSLNKQANVICGDFVPAKYDYLSEGIDIQDFEPEFILAVDIADPKLLGKNLSHYGDKVDLCIDHHGSNTGYAKKLLLDDTCAACAEIIYDIINKAIKVYVHDSPDKAYCSWYYDTYGDDGISNLDNYSTISYAEASYICHNCKEHDCSKCKIWEIAR